MKTKSQVEIGFTLIEALVCIIILGVIFSIFIPRCITGGKEGSQRIAEQNARLFAQKTGWTVLNVFPDNDGDGLARVTFGERLENGSSQLHTLECGADIFRQDIGCVEMKPNVYSR